MLTMNNNFCCRRLQLWIESDDCSLRYDAKNRYYGISVPQLLIKRVKGWPSYPVTFCPACGTKLPSDLVEERIAILKNEYNINDPFDDKQKKLIPQEFFTDEWWKKRGF